MLQKSPCFRDIINIAFKYLDTTYIRIFSIKYTVCNLFKQVHKLNWIFDSIGPHYVRFDSERSDVITEHNGTVCRAW